MRKFLLSTKAKSDLIKIARYTQLTWGKEQRNDYLKILAVKINEQVRSHVLSR